MYERRILGQLSLLLIIGIRTHDILEWMGPNRV